MGRLIDADALIDEINTISGSVYHSEKPTTLDFNIGLSYAIQMVRAQSTAFDLEKVVAELEKLRTMEVDMIGGYCQSTLSKAIETVRKGGVE